MNQTVADTPTAAQQIRDAKADRESGVAEALKTMGKSGFVVGEVEIITPSIAAEYLKNNEGNRQVMQSRVKEYATEIKSGRWRHTHQGIAFDRQGNILDGQHRLSAIVRAGVPVRMAVYRDQDRENFDKIDTGYNRGNKDQYTLRGGVHTKNATKIVGIARAMLCAGTKGVRFIKGKNQLNRVVAEYAMKHEDLINKFWEAARKSLCKNSGWIAAFLNCAIHYEDKEDFIFEELKRVAEREFKGPNDPIKHLDKYLMRASQPKSGNSAAQSYIVYRYALNAIRKSIRGEGCNQLSPTTRDFENNERNSFLFSVISPEEAVSAAREVAKDKYFID